MYFCSILFVSLFAGVLSTPAIPSNGRIIGGVEATANEFPFICSLARQTENGLRNTCAVTILTEHWFLTAAHCVMVEAWIQDLEIHCGRHDLSDLNENVQIRSIDRHVLHEGWEFTETNQTVWLDIAVIYTETPLVFNEIVSYINLPRLGYDATGQGVIIGWGIYQLEGEIRPYRLQKAVVPIHDDETCANHLQGFLEGWIFYLENLLCTGEIGGSVIGCGGDSGGPIVQETEFGWFQVGIISFGGSPCGAFDSVLGNVKVSQFTDWIENAIYENTPTTTLVPETNKF